MPATPEATARTRAFARVIGPFVTIVTAIVIVRVPDMAAGKFLNDVFASQVVVWMLGAMLLMFGLVIIAFHQYWKGAAAILISLFGWFVALRGLALLAAPQLIERGAYASMASVPLVQAGFSVLTIVGLWLTYVGWIKESASGS